MRADAHIRRFGSTLAPHGLLDIVRQVLLFGSVYAVYRLTRGLVDSPDGAVGAFSHARDIIEFEQATKLFFEAQIQHWTEGLRPALDVATWIYMNAQTTVMFTVLVYIYVRHNHRFYFVRNIFMVAMAIALVGYIFYPVAPPRFFPEWGFHDSVAQFVGVDQHDSVNAFFNPYAAVPSMHCANAIIIGLSLAQILRGKIVRILWSLYPAIMFWVVVATANHWTVDAILGALTAGVSYAAAAAMAQTREVWRFNRPPTTVKTHLT